MTTETITNPCSARARAILAAGLLVCLFALCGAADARAAEPWWHVNVVSASPKAAGGEGQVLVEVANLGDAATVPTEPVTLTDTLPAGVTVTFVHAGGGGGDIGINAVDSHTTCSTVGQVIRCQFEGLPLFAYERFIIVLHVTIAPGAGTGVNEATVAGGGAAPVRWRRPLRLGSSAPPVGVENYELTPEEEGGAPDTQAGSHPFQLTTTLALNSEAAPTEKEFGGPPEPTTEVRPGAFTKDLRFNLPAGLVGNPTQTPRCSIHVFDLMVQSVGECPRDSIIGVVTPITTNKVNNAHEPYAFSTPLYNLEPAPGEPARFGFSVVEAEEPVILDTKVRTGGDYGVTVTVSNITQAVEFLGSQVTFWGVPADPRHDTTRGQLCLVKFEAKSRGEGEGFEFDEKHCPAENAPRPFLILPTSCQGPLHTTVEADSWEHPNAYTEPQDYTFQNQEGEPFGLDGCNRLGFEPSISVTPDGQQGSTPTGLTVGVHVPQDAGLNPTGLAEANVKDTTVALPAGVGLNPAGADGLMACGLGEIILESPEEQSCPEAAKVATVEIETPLLPNKLEGAAYLATQDANPFGSLIALYIVARDPVSGTLVKLAGQVTPDPVTGQLTSTFKNTPQLPFENLRLHFFGGSRAPLGTPALCGTYTTTASISPWSGNPPVGSSSQFQITSGPNGAPCSDPLPFSPSLTTGSLNLQAGAFTPFTTTMSREDGQQALQGIQLHMPPGLSGLLTGVKLCGEAEANAGTCGPESLIGETTVSVGLGGNPFSVKGGRVYITGAHDGTPFGLSIVNPAKAGPYDLEKETACDCLVVRAKIEVDPHTAALTITTDNTGPYKIPTILQGIPLEIQHVNVIISREHFTFNPTNCSKMAITGSLASTEGASSALSVPFQVTNCAILKFAPKFAVSTSGKTSRSKGASLNVKLTYPKAPFGSQANIARVKVDLPKQLPSRLTTLQKACTAAQFELNPANCPKASFIGHAKATTPLIPVPLEGPAIFVSHGGEAFPSLIVVLQGYGVTLDLVGSTFISKAGITSSTFKTVPDAPVGSFELTLPEGKFSALAANGNLCTTKLAMPTEFLAQNGLKINQSTPISVTGCAKTKTLTRAQKLAAAMKACHKKHGASRKKCESAAKKSFGPLKHKKAKK
jgi:hypothetical protein